MDVTFSENLSKLRKERGLNQRKAAAELKISQALLSHYENGIREPGLDFVIRVCEYYGVSADFMLGRTSVRETAPSGGTPETESAQQEVIVLAAVLFRLLEQADGKLASETLKYMTCAQYVLLRGLLENSENGQFSLPPEQAAVLSEVELKLISMRLRDGLKASGVKLSAETVKKSLSKTTYKIFEGALSRLEGELREIAKQ